MDAISDAFKKQYGDTNNLFEKETDQEFEDRLKTINDSNECHKEIMRRMAQYGDQAVKIEEE